MKNATLTLVGSGIKFLAHLTVEAKASIEQSDKVLYLVNEPAMKEWIRKRNANSESLEHLYTSHPRRLECYREITNYILEILRQGQHVCVVLYGHPTVFAQPGLNAVIQAVQEGYEAKVLPAVSAEDCLYADLLIDPGTVGCQSFETTDFLIHRRLFDPSSHLILWQVSSVGVLSHSTARDNSKGIQFLLNYLTQYYPVDHQVILYEAAQYPMFKPKIYNFPLEKITEMAFSRISTLYVPPAFKTPVDKSTLALLNIDLADLQ